MNVVIHQSNPHTTHDGHTATYAICRDALTGQRVAMLQVVMLEEGATEYRTMDRRSLPRNFTFDEAMTYAASEESKRRAQRPPQPPRPRPSRGGSRGRRQRPTWWYRPPAPASPARRQLVAKLAERYARKAAA